jgi:endonuclease YncB( thermonuclease family)
MRRILPALCACALAFAVAGAPRTDGRLAGLPRVVDGDTLAFGDVHVRLFGIDSPEPGQTCDRNGQPWDCGAFASRLMADLVGTAGVTCDAPVDTDRHNRPVAVCRAAGADLGAAMVEAGAAFAYRRYSTDYVAQEQAARAAGLGIWAGRVATPEAHRHADLSPRPGPGPDHGCRIKGNINNGRRIYHMPGDRHYDKARVSQPGEAWFCTAGEAEAAGFRRSKV